MIKLTRPDCPNPRALEKGNYKHANNKEALRNAASGKCMYCESKISHVDHAHIEHIKPKAADKFPELEFVWSNLGYSCEICNGHKHDKYIADTPYIDPYAENPEAHIVFHGWVLFPKNGSERGELTITDLGLNRPELIEQRQERIEKFILAINACYRTNNETLRNAALKSLGQEALPDKEYSYAILCTLKAHDIPL
ncbi:HNH endonuclease [Shewanella sp. HN-41]|uniref:HNH endonuclease n=1 Tax=Shewanella sp. HN-41 TaxID=327275 RepID=UPI000560E676|nr:HNH endonuclease [Shewanella sp. HN-41]